MTNLPTLDVKSNIQLDTKTSSGKLSRVIAVLLVVLLVVFFLLTMTNNTTINRQIDTIQEGPYPVSVAAGRVETLLVRLRTVSERPIYVRTEDALDNVEENYTDSDEEIMPHLEFIKENMEGDQTISNKLYNDYQILTQYQDEYLEFTRQEGVTNDEVRTEAQKIFDLIDSMLIDDVSILDETTNQVNHVYDTVNRALFQNAIIETALMAAVLSSLAIYLTLLGRKNAQERKLRDNLENALELAQSANAAKSAFLSNMSHDIRTPMNAIIGLTSIANTHIDDKVRVKECLARISTSSKHLLGLINDVLDMGKIESGKLTLNEERFSFPNLVNEFITIIQPQIRAKRLKFDVVISNVEEEMLVADTMRLNQILLNLASNAIKYTPEGKAVRIEIREEPSVLLGYHNYRFTFKDEGIGMEPEFLERVFDPFERENNETTNFTEGTGLGLAITKNIVDLMKGTISVTSEVGVGSTFTVVIPMKASEEDRESYDTEALKGIHALVVDDDESILENTLLIFNDFQMRGECASSGIDALALTTHAHEIHDDFNAIIVDWIMPDMDGLETIRQIRTRIGEATPIVLLTAYDWTEIEDEAKEAGVSAFISKPLFKSRLYHVLHGLCVEDDHPTVIAKKAAGKIPASGRVLLVEDNEINSEIAKELIEDMGAIVELASDGIEAVEMFDATEADHYQLILMDWQMPRMDGIEATKTIIAHAKASGKPHPPIVAMTANAFNEHRDIALSVGMDDFLTKPVNVKELDWVLHRYLS